jgi:hypothetical protein
VARSGEEAWTEHAHEARGIAMGRPTLRLMAGLSKGSDRRERRARQPMVEQCEARLLLYIVYGPLGPMPIVRPAHGFDAIVLKTGSPTEPVHGHAHGSSAHPTGPHHVSHHWFSHPGGRGR